LIKIENLTFWYGDAATPAVREVSLEIGDGEFVLLTGPSGGGKSTLCRCLNGLIPHFYGGRITGRVEVNGLDITQHSTRELALKVGMIFQDPENQLVAGDAEREIAFGMENLAFPGELMAKRMEESLDTLGISAIRHRRTGELSGGEKQKVVIASVLALHPAILVLDEPTSELDPGSAEEVLAAVGRLNDELGLTVILVEHRLDRVAQHVDRLLVLSGGAVIADGSPRSVLGGDKITDTGVGLPPIISLARGLRERGIGSGETPLTVKEGRMALGKVFQRRFKASSSAPAARPEPPSPSSSPGRPPLIEIKKLWHAYPGGHVALRDINLSIYEGEFIAVMGRNASGKTTLVKHINGLLKPTKGDVMVGGTNTREATIAELARKVGFVFQNPNDHLFADTVEEEIAVTLKNFGFNDNEAAARVDEMLEKFSLGEYRQHYPRSLSGGEKQRVALASVIAAHPGILILDEPTRGMEYRLKRELMAFLGDYRRQGGAVILVTHDVETVAEHADRVMLLSEGRVVVCGSRREVLSGALLFSPQINRLVQAFAGYGVPGDILTADEVLEMLG
jgi:energy-coupling factor transport system ATP-binding protein